MLPAATSKFMKYQWLTVVKVASCGIFIKARPRSSFHHFANMPWARTLSPGNLTSREAAICEGTREYFLSTNGLCHKEDDLWLVIGIVRWSLQLSWLYLKVCYSKRKTWMLCCWVSIWSILLSHVFFLLLMKCSFPCKLRFSLRE